MLGTLHMPLHSTTRDCQNWMLAQEYNELFEEGKATIRRFDKVIEQNLMRLLKIKRGLKRGRGMTESTLAKFSDAFQEVIPIIEALEILYCEVNTTTSEQHKDLRESSVRKHNDNVKTFIVWLEQHPPCKGNAYLKNIATGRPVSRGEMLRLMEFSTFFISYSVL